MWRAGVDARQAMRRQRARCRQEVAEARYERQRRKMAAQLGGTLRACSRLVRVAGRTAAHELVQRAVTRVLAMLPQEAAPAAPVTARARRPREPRPRTSALGRAVAASSAASNARAAAAAEARRRAEDERRRRARHATWVSRRAAMQLAETESAASESDGTQRGPAQKRTRSQAAADRDGGGDSRLPDSGEGGAAAPEGSKRRRVVRASTSTARELRRR